MKSLLTIFCVWILWFNTSGKPYFPLKSFDEMGPCEEASNKGNYRAKQEAKQVFFWCLPDSIDPRS